MVKTGSSCNGFDPHNVHMIKTLRIGNVELDGISKVHTDIDNTSEYRWHIIINYENARLATLKYKKKDVCVDDLKSIMEKC